MELTVEQNCPSCGASIVLSETDRLVKCSFCDVYNYRLGLKPAKYVLPSALPDHISEESVFYIPYIRFKGSVYYVRDAKVLHKIIDTTRIGVADDSFPLSLGLRPQAMKVKPVVSSTQGGFVKQSVETKAVFSHAVAIVDLFSSRNQKKVLHRSFIGETISRVYQPYYVHEDMVYDAVDNRALCSQSKVKNTIKSTMSSKVSWEPQFISTLCPQCGALLSGERDSLVLHCQNCQTHWQEQGERFIPVRWKVVEGSLDMNNTALPFWKISFTTTGKVLRSFGDFLRFTNQPVIVQKKFEEMKLTFRIPAFKIKPKSFLQIASRLTVGQLRLPSEYGVKLNNPHPVNLGQSEAIQAIKSVLAATTVDKKTLRLFLSKIVVVDPECTLEYLPFTKHTHDFIQEHTGTTIRTAALRFGRKL